MRVFLRVQSVIDHKVSICAFCGYLKMMYNYDFKLIEEKEKK